jgi:hypothetical protein
VSKKVTLEMDVHSAAEVRRILFEAQKGYTYEVQSVPNRIFNVREVITDLDDAISQVVE